FTAPATLTVAANTGPHQIHIPMPTDAAYSNVDDLAATVTGLPSNGTVFLADGTTPVTLNNVLTLDQLVTLTFQPTPGLFGQTSTLKYEVADTTFSTANGTVDITISSEGNFNFVTGWDFSWHVIASGDFNKDGNTDVIWDNGHGVEGGWLMANAVRAGTLQLPFFPDWHTVGTGDFNRDGNTDIMWQNGDGLVAEWFMGNGTRQGTAVVQNMAGWHVIATGDFNHDGIGDVIWDNGNGVEGGWLIGHDGQIGGTLQLPFFPSWSVIGTGDFNQDGNTDILWRNADGLVAEWLMGNGTRQATMVIQNMAGWSAIATGDFNGDGTDD